MKDIIRIQNLRFQYPGSSSPVLQRLDLCIRERETFGIIGSTGAGKSTLVFHLNGILQGTGRVEIAGLPVSKENLRQIRRQVGIVFQNPDDQLFCPTVYDDIAFGLIQGGAPPAEISEKVDKILHAFDLTAYASRSSYHLSQGEKKRVAIASIMVMTPSIVCFDEPFANLDYQSVFQVIREIQTLDITKLIVSQDVLLTMALCDRIAVLSQGRILCVDTPRRVMTRQEHLLARNGLNYRPYLDLIRKFQ